MLLFILSRLVMLCSRYFHRVILRNFFATAICCVLRRQLRSMPPRHLYRQSLYPAVARGLLLVHALLHWVCMPWAFYGFATARPRSLYRRSPGRCRLLCKWLPGPSRRLQRRRLNNRRRRHPLHRPRHRHPKPWPPRPSPRRHVRRPPSHRPHHNLPGSRSPKSRPSRRNRLLRRPSRCRPSGLRQLRPSAANRLPRHPSAAPVT